MIEKMKIVHILAAESHKADMLDSVRDLGLVHIAEKKAADPAVADRFSNLTKTLTQLKELPSASSEKPAVSDEEFEVLDGKVRDAIASKKTLLQAKDNAALEAEKLKGWGDFVPEEIEALAKDGVEFHFYRMGKKEFGLLSENQDISFIRLSPVDKMETVAVIGKLDPSFPATEFVVPARGYSQLIRDIAEDEASIRECDETLKDASRYLKSYEDQILKTKNDVEYSAASCTTENDSGLIWLTGYIPEVNVEQFRNAAADNGWAYAMDDVAEDDENVPTKIRYTKLTALIQPVFDILGTVPGYREYDISFWFLCFFALFFAMIIGDAGYGVLFLIGAVVLHIKSKKVTNAILLLYVVSAATIIWGALTGTWFGWEGAMKIPFLKSLVIPSFANYPEYFGVSATEQQNAIMKFCFIIGTVQLSLACVMNIRRKIGEHNLSWIADLGWFLSINALYYVVLFLVIGENVNLGVSAVIVGIGFILVVLFAGMSPDKTFGQGLKAGLGNAFTDFLDTISAFGNVMSYIRLFAVGMASLAIAQSFNNMAAGFDGPLVIVGAIIVVIGHVLNIVMGFLSVVVHGVRLNLLEYSGQLGMEWSGTAYEPFQKLKK